MHHQNRPIKRQRKRRQAWIVDVFKAEIGMNVTAKVVAFIHYKIHRPHRLRTMQCQTVQ